jgi:hypothetical protein
MLSLLLAWGCSGKIDGTLGAPGAGPGDGSGFVIDPETGELVPASERSDDDEQPASGDPSTGAPGGDGDGDPSSDDAADVCATLDVGITPLRRLTREEYDNTVADLLGTAQQPARAFSPDEKLLGFAAGLSVTPLLVDQYMTASEELAAEAVTDLPALLGCDPAALDAAAQESCAHDFIDGFGARAYRRPLETEERDGLRGLFATGRDGFDFATGIELVLRAVLQSPQFLYRVELGRETATPDVVQLTPHELATRLSYFLWQTMPDAELIAAAEAGELDTPEGIEARARAMVQDARAERAVDGFHSQWLELELLETAGKDPAVYPEFDDELRHSMAQELLRFTREVVFEGDGNLEALLTDSHGYVDTHLASVYGLDPADFGEEQVRTELDRGQRAGVMTSPAVMTIHAKSNQSSPVHRGKFVRERLLCQPLSPPPADLVIIPPDPAPDASTRERFREHSEDPSCAGCHRLTDPIGFGFEGYDGIGRFREMDGEFPVDASGEVFASRDADGPFDGAVELATRLAASQEVADCMASQWFVYALGRSMTNTLDACSRQQVLAAFDASGHDIRELMVALTATDAFRYRRMPTDDEGGAP